MASFRGHVAVGGATAATSVAALSAFTPVTDIPTLASVCGLVLVGSALPDIDSDTSMPFYLAFGTATLVVLAMVIHRTFLVTTDSNQLILIPLATLVFFWFIIGGIVKHLTRHRGMIHSIPALLVASLGTVYLAHTAGFDSLHATLFGIAIGLGFLSHLVLDEIYAGVNIHGIPFIPNKAFGSALKFGSRSHVANIFFYAITALFLFLTFPILSSSIPLIAPYVWGV